jgi:hypothetical protein
MPRKKKAKVDNNDVVVDVVVDDNVSYEIKGRDGTKKTVVKLSVPGEDDECPLALDSMRDAKLQFYEASFFIDRPELQKLTLPCGHSFSAMLLVYSFCKNNMTCPCCRSGHDCKADIGCLPEHMRLEFNKRVAVPEAEDEEVTLVGISVPFRYQTAGALSLAIDFYDSADASPVFSTINNLIATQQAGTIVPVFTTIGPLAGLGAICHLLMLGMNLARVSIQMELFGGERITIDHSDLIDLSIISDALLITVPGARASSSSEGNLTLNSPRNTEVARRNLFDVAFRSVLRANSARHVLLDKVTWRPSAGDVV